ncbi:Pregnancy-associated plasma protein-A [compost metagenome]
MKKLFFSVALLCGFTSYSQVTPSKAQSSDSPREVEKCSQHHYMQDLKLKHPERYASIFRGTDEPKSKGASSGFTVKSTGVVYTIPVVFHILHTNGSENISDAQVADALAILNRDFRRLNADANSVYSSFQGMPTDAEINFVFATVAPNGNCFSGITRTVTQTTHTGDGIDQANAVIAGNNVYQGLWAHSKYLNIYVCNDLQGAAGYTYLPNGGSAPSAEDMHYNGVYILHDYCGSIGTGSPGASRALTHEIGHWLNLSHTWGDDNNPGEACGDDYVSDTPVTEGFFSCPNPNSARICNANIVENYENYMDYSYCSKMYTQGQVTRMRNALTSGEGGRNNIWTTANLNQVGGGSGTSLCALDFSASQSTLCAAGTITFSSSPATGIATYSWSFPGGTPATSTAANPTVTYATPGTYNANLTVTSSSNGASYSKSKTNYVLVNPNTTVSLPISEGFASTTFPPSGWEIVNPNNNATWTRSTTVGVSPTAGNSLRFNNLSNNDSQNDEMRLPKADLEMYSSAQLTFDIAYAPYNASRYDGLEILVSTNCGGSFTSVYSKSNTTLATANATTSTFIPNDSQWRSETVDLSSFAGSGSVWIVFKNIAGNGNNLYIDNINVTGTTTGLSVNQNELNLVSVYPNPSTGLVTINSGSASLDAVKVFNSVGQVVYEIKGLEAGKQELDLGSMAKGVYTLHVLTDKGTQHVSIVLEK